MIWMISVIRVKITIVVSKLNMIYVISVRMSVKRSAMGKAYFPIKYLWYICVIVHLCVE